MEIRDSKESGVNPEQLIPTVKGTKGQDATAVCAVGRRSSRMNLSQDTKLF